MKLLDFMANSDAAWPPDYIKRGTVRSVHYKKGSLQQFYQVQKRLQFDLLACDLRFSLFVAAASNYRYAKLVRPFPKEFLDNKRRPNIDAVFEVIAEMDRLEVILEQLVKGNSSCHQVDVISLLHAVLVRHGERVALSSLRTSEFEDLYSHLQIPAPQTQPTHIFEVTPSLKCSHTKAYTSRSEQFPVAIGFYGGKLEHLYVMLTMGSMPLNEPVQLTHKMDEALMDSPKCPSWGPSRCGAMARFVALIEYVMDPAYVTEDRNTSRIIVSDASCLQISYLMIYGERCDEHVQELVRQPRWIINWHDTVKWMENNKYVLSLGVYLMILSVSTTSGRGLLHKFVCTGLFVLRKGFLKF